MSHYNDLAHACTETSPPPIPTLIIQSIVSHYDDLFMVLAPYLHGERYSSYGRHFTSKHLLHRVADRWGEGLDVGAMGGEGGQGAEGLG